MLPNCACQRIIFGFRINVFIPIFIFLKKQPNNKKMLSWRSSILLRSWELKMNGCPTPCLQKKKKLYQAEEWTSVTYTCISGIKSGHVSKQLHAQMPRQRTTHSPRTSQYSSVNELIIKHLWPCQMECTMHNFVHTTWRFLQELTKMFKANLFCACMYPSIHTTNQKC